MTKNNIITVVEQQPKFLRLFSLVKFYKLGSGWIRSKKTRTNLNEYIYCLKKSTYLLFMDKILVFLKKSFLIFESIIKEKGLFLFIGVHFCYFKESKSIFFYLREKCLISYLNGFFSNFLYRHIFMRSFPDLILFFNSHRNNVFLKEIKTLGIPSIGSSDISTFTSLIEYPLFFNFQSYFINFFFLNIYSKLIFLNKN